MGGSMCILVGIMKASELKVGNKYTVNSSPDNVWEVVKVGWRQGSVKIDIKWISGALDHSENFKHRQPSTVTGWAAQSPKSNVTLITNHNEK